MYNIHIECPIEKFEDMRYELGVDISKTSPGVYVDYFEFLLTMREIGKRLWEDKVDICNDTLPIHANMFDCVESATAFASYCEKVYTGTVATFNYATGNVTLLMSLGEVDFNINKLIGGGKLPNDVLDRFLPYRSVGNSLIEEELAEGIDSKLESLGNDDIWITVHEPDGKRGSVFGLDLRVCSETLARKLLEIKAKFTVLKDDN